MGLTKKQLISKLSVTEARQALEAAIKRDHAAAEKRNRAFSRLSDRRKRVTIAQDVLGQLAAKRLIATFGTYLRVPDSVEDRFDTDTAGHSDAQVHEILDDVKCQVCGIGSLFVAAVDRIDSCTVGDMDGVDNSAFMREYLGKFFDGKQLALIETAFEGRLISSADTDLYDGHSQVRAAIEFTEDLSSATLRLRKIMKNIIQHDGTFRP